jgi:hypothetical protein
MMSLFFFLWRENPGLAARLWDPGRYLNRPSDYQLGALRPDPRCSVEAFSVIPYFSLGLVTESVCYNKKTTRAIRSS